MTTWADQEAIMLSGKKISERQIAYDFTHMWSFPYMWIFLICGLQEYRNLKQMSMGQKTRQTNNQTLNDREHSDVTRGEAGRETGETGDGDDGGNLS